MRHFRKLFMSEKFDSFFGRETVSVWNKILHPVVLLGGLSFPFILVNAFCPRSLCIYVLNGHYLALRSMFTDKSAKVRYFVVEWDEKDLSFASFLEDVVGDKAPLNSKVGSIRWEIFSNWKSCKLSEQPNRLVFHSSESAFQAMAERMNWLKESVTENEFSKALLKAGMSNEVIAKWIFNPMYDGRRIFSHFEGMDASNCVRTVASLCGLRRRPKFARNSAFLFLYPGAATDEAATVVHDVLSRFGLTVTLEGEISGSKIDEEGIADMHFFPLAQAALAAPDEAVNPSPKRCSEFEAEFRNSWSQMLTEGRVVPAMYAAHHLNCGTDEVIRRWELARKLGDVYAMTQDVSLVPMVYTPWYLNDPTHYWGMRRVY
eukprot:TRINITY_DN5098_c0_g1_i1.p1 TRINITY_DN5098_c0_g1~~TRINITY_DN5098_c0_g1_i1.p1  ORF type:complete len:374 (+),score=51.89 TRINITY_DN5098_c0_g1_i1:49-1170(+)